MIPLFSLPLIFPALAAAAAAAAARPRSVITQGDGYLKATLNPIRGVPPVLGKRASVEAAILGRQNGLHYVIDIGVGTPPQVQTLIVDTGSPDLWLNPRCETYSKPAECLAHPQFDYTKSSTLTVLGASANLYYGSGNVSVDVVTDTLTIGGTYLLLLLLLLLLFFFLYFLGGSISINLHASALAKIQTEQLPPSRTKCLVSPTTLSTSPWAFSVSHLQ